MVYQLNQLAHEGASPALTQALSISLHLFEDAWRTATRDGLYALHERVLKPILGIDPTEGLLEVGVGSGNHLNSYRGYRYWGIDVDLEKVRIARRMAEECAISPLQIVQNAPGDVPFDEHTFERVMAVCTLHEVEDIPRMLSEIDRVLKPSGRVGIIERMTAHGESAEAQERLRQMPAVLRTWFGSHNYTFRENACHASYYGECLRAAPLFPFYVFNAVKPATR